jgi:hypothetical protein
MRKGGGAGTAWMNGKKTVWIDQNTADLPAVRD